MPSLAPLQDITYSFSVKGGAIRVTGSVNNGGADNTKAFVGIVQFFDKADTLIDGPYEGLSTSKLGSYRYLAGGTDATPTAFAMRAVLPKGAIRASVIFKSWDYKLPISMPAHPTAELYAAKKA